MQTIITKDASAMGAYAAFQAAEQLRTKLSNSPGVNLVIATGASQFEVLANLIEQPGIDWSRVTGFHLDEYVGLAADHPASFCGYLRERFVERVPLADFHYLVGDRDPSQTIRSVGNRLRDSRIDLLLCGIGENGHLAFNDPPADFETTEPYLIVELDEPCRQQQVGEGWFDSLDQVPSHAMSMSVNQIMKADRIICSVPDNRKAKAVRRTLLDDISPSIPASILRDHPDATLVIDEAAAVDLPGEVRAQFHG